MAQNNQSALEFTDPGLNQKPDQNGANDTEQKKSKPRLTIAERFQKFLTFFTVEPFLLCYILPSIISSLAIQKLNMEKACRVDLNYTEEVCTNVVEGNIDDNITLLALDGAQILVADMTAWRQPIQSGIPAIAILFVGAWSDRTGNRKLLLLVPILGELISSFGLVLATYYFDEWPLWITGLIEGLPPALTGGWSIALMGSYSFIADVTTLEERTFRIGVVAVIVTLGIPLGSSISGVLTEAVGYYGIFGIGVLLYAIGFVHTYFRIHDVRINNTKGTCVEFFHPRNIWDTISLMFQSNKRQRLQVILVVMAHVVIIGPVFAEGAVLYLYTLKKFNMDVVEFSLFSTYSVLMGLIGTAVAVTIFSRLMKMHDAFIGIIATACKVLSSFVYALAPTLTVFYFGPAVDFFGNAGVTAIRSLGTKVVEPTEVGKMCSLIGFAEAIVPVIYTPIYSKLYSNTLETFPGAFYILGGLMTIPAFVIFVVLYVMQRKQERDVVKNPEAKEQYAHENDVTAL